MSNFYVTTEKGISIRFNLYLDAAPVTCAAFLRLLPFTSMLYHARVSGQEIWMDNLPPLDIIQENASVFTEPGEVVLGPARPARNKTANCLGIYYGEGKGLDACNIFAKVHPEDQQKLVDLGNEIWRNGARALVFGVG